MMMKLLYLIAFLIFTCSIQAQDKIFMLKDGVKQPMRVYDSTAISNQLNLKVNFTDTASMLSAYQTAINGKQPLLINPVTGSGTTNYLPKWTPSGTNLGNSGLSDNGTNVTSSLHFVPAANNTKDLGLSGTSWRTGYFGTSIYTPSTYYNGVQTHDKIDFDVINNLIRTQPYHTFRVTRATGSSSTLFDVMDNTASPAGILMNVRSSTTSFLAVNGVNGNVGIGTSSPSSRLQLDGTSASNNLIINTTDAAAVSFGTLLNVVGTKRAEFSLNASSGEIKIGATNGGGFYPTFYSNGSEIMRMTTAGNVGIGTTSPASKFHIANTATATANNEVASLNVAGTLTARATAADVLYSMRNTQAFTAAANNQQFVGLSLSPTYSVGAFTGNVGYPLEIKGTNGEGLFRVRSNVTGGGITYVGDWTGTGYSATLTLIRPSGGYDGLTITQGNGDATFNNPYGSITFNQAGAASQPAFKLTGNPYTAGTATTNHPLIYANGGTAPTTWSTAGTYLGVNANSTFTGNFIDLHKDGGSSVFKVDANGAITIANGINATSGSLILGPTNIMWFNGRAYWSSPADGIMQVNGSTPAINIGGSTSSFPQVRQNGTGIDIKLADGSDYTYLGAKRFLVNGSLALSDLGSGRIDVGRAGGFSTLVAPTSISGGIGTTSTLIIKPTTGAGTTGADVIVAVGNNGATEAMRILNSGNIGIGTTSPNSTTHVNGSFAKAYRAITASRTLDGTDNIINCTANTFTVTLPTAASIAGRQYTIVNTGSGTITIGTTSSQTFTNINATPTTLTLAPVGAGAIVSYTVVSDGANWIVTAKVKDE